jgi:hypothetical protein
MSFISESAEEVTNQQSTERAEQETQPQSATSDEESPEVDIDFKPDVCVQT